MLVEGRSLNQSESEKTVARLHLSGICKAFPGVVANDNVDLQVASGEIHALLGENGAGKSTLMKMIYGLLKPDSGNIRWNGETLTQMNPNRARQLGIGMVFQHFSLFETTSMSTSKGSGTTGNV